MGESPIAVGAMLTSDPTAAKNARIMVISTILGLVLGRALSWLIANAFRPSIGALAPAVALLLYFLVVITVGTVVGCLDATDMHHVFAIAFAVGFVISPSLLREIVQSAKTHRLISNLMVLIAPAAMMLVAVLTGFWIAHLSLLYR